MRCSLCALALLLTSAQTAAEQQPDSLRPVPLKAGTVSLSPSNSHIHFIGTHEGPKPDPRKGGFAKFTGEATASDGGGLQSVNFDIETESLYTEIPKLTNHLKSADFFSVREHPKATFRSSSIRPSNETGNLSVTGDFTLIGNTREIEIPARVAVTPKGLTLVSEFVIDRTQFGMNYGQGRVKKDVAISVVIGAPSTPK